MPVRPFASMLAFVLAACSPGTVGQPLPEDAALRLNEAGADPESLGELVYHGRVQERGDHADALFRYERRVERLDTGWVGTHLTYDADEAPVILHVATYTDRYELVSFEEIHGQTGLVSRADVGAKGELDLSVTLGGVTETSVEPDGDPVHTGPSLFGFALENWEAMVDGEKQQLRFLVTDAGRTYRFALKLESSDRQTTVFKMTATNAIVRLAVPTMRITFDTATRSPVRFEGLVPPMTGPNDDLRKLDARVDYVNVSDVYR